MRIGIGKARGETSISMDMNGMGKALDTMHKWHSWRFGRINDFTDIMRVRAVQYERNADSFGVKACQTSIAISADRMPTSLRERILVSISRHRAANTVVFTAKLKTRNRQVLGVAAPPWQHWL